MQKNSNRKGLALGAVFALIAGLFGAVPAASAATDGANIGAYPAQGTTFVGTLAEDFPVYLQLKPGQSNAAFETDLVFKVVSSADDMDVMASASAAVSDLTSATSQSNDISAVITDEETVATFSGIVSDAGAAYVNFFADTTSAVASWSAVTLTVTAFIDNQGGAKNDVIDSDEWFTTFTVTLINPEDITGTVSLTQPLAGDDVVTVSSNVSGLNFANLSGGFFLAMSSSDTIYNSSANATDVGTVLSGTTVALRSGVVSESFDVSALAAADSVSAALRYVPGGSASTIYDGYLVGSVVALGATAASITAVSVDVVESDHSTASNTTFPVRPNQTYTVRVQALTNSVSVSGISVNVALSGTDLVEGLKMISINGGAATTSYPAALALTTAGVDGYATFTLTTTGFIAGENVLVTATSGNASSDTANLVATTPVYSIVNDYDLYVTTPGAAVTLGYTVEDQWQVAQSVGSYRLQVTRGGTGFSYTTTVSDVAVAAGAASFAFTPSPATKTGSAVVSAVLQKWDANLNSWISGGSADSDVTVNVTSVADAFSTAAVVSFSASVSYFPSTVSWETVTGTAKNAGSTVVISGDSSLVFRASAAKPTTASGTLTVRADANGGYTFQVASLHDGNHTISQTVGTSVTTSLMVVDAVAADAGKSISFDTTTIGAGSTATVTGTLVDANGNPVNTSGSATIVVTYTGAGIPIGTMPTETDEDGEFSFTVLTGASDKGTATVTAVYLKSGAGTAAADKITATQTITIGAAAVAVSDQKLTIGTFNGYIAIYAKGYEGQKLSYKVAGKWGVVDSLDAFQRVVRKTGAGYEIKVDLYIDGVFAKTQTTLTK